MSFNSLIFALFFLPITLLFYHISKKKYKNTILLLASILFYLWGSSKAILIVFVSILINYILAIIMEKFPKHKKQVLFLTIATNILILIYYKYTNFFIGILNKNFTPLKILVPLGISYITFQQISYVVDVYREKSKVQKNFINFALYILFFPKIIAGPITQYNQIDKQLTDRKLNLDQFEEGIYRFCIGLGKKIIIASTIQKVVDEIFKIAPHNLGLEMAWLGMLAYTLQIYFDFSGYTDMAIGIAKMFSFNLPENFDKPYTSHSIGEFWRRWHITLSFFLRDYIYIPLGGSRCSKKRILFNTFVIFFLSGFWHGANYTFIIWGLYHCFFVAIEKFGVKAKIINKLPKIITQFTAFIIVGIGWVFFRAENLHYALSFVKAMVNIKHIKPLTTLSLSIDTQFIIVFIFALIISIIPKLHLRERNKIFFSLARVLSICIFVYSLAIVTTGSFMPFIYFKF